MMLAEAADRVMPGGSLVYCTCSLEPEEGEKQISLVPGRLSSISRWFRLVREFPKILKSDWGWLRLHPLYDDRRKLGMDGFFMARLDRMR